MDYVTPLKLFKIFCLPIACRAQSGKSTELKRIFTRIWYASEFYLMDHNTSQSKPRLTERLIFRISMKLTNRHPQSADKLAHYVPLHVRFLLS